jgi:hypothetical protein
MLLCQGCEDPSSLLLSLPADIRREIMKKLAIFTSHGSGLAVKLALPSDGSIDWETEKGETLLMRYMKNMNHFDLWKSYGPSFREEYSNVVVGLLQAGADIFHRSAISGQTVKDCCTLRDWSLFYEHTFMAFRIFAEGRADPFSSISALPQDAWGKVATYLRRFISNGSGLAASLALHDPCLVG